MEQKESNPTNVPRLLTCAHNLEDCTGIQNRSQPCNWRKTDLLSLSRCHLSSGLIPSDALFVPVFVWSTIRESLVRVISLLETVESDWRKIKNVHRKCLWMSSGYCENKKKTFFLRTGCASAVISMLQCGLLCPPHMTSYAQHTDLITGGLCTDKVKVSFQSESQLTPALEILSLCHINLFGEKIPTTMAESKRNTDLSARKMFLILKQMPWVVLDLLPKRPADFKPQTKCTLYFVLRAQNLKQC